VRNCVFSLAAALLVLTVAGQAKADYKYKIPDDCIGTWRYCKSFRFKHFMDYGPYFTDDSPFLAAPDLDDPFPERIQPLSPPVANGAPDIAQ
jgi:hypothetical protein